MNKQPPVGASPGHWIVMAALAAVALGGLLVWGFVEGRGDAAAEAEREQPVEPAVQVSRNTGAPPKITLGPDLRKLADIRVVQLKAAPYQPRIQAYGSVLELQPFTQLSDAIASAKAQLAVARAKLAASQAAYQRARLLHQNGQNVSTAQLQAADATYLSDLANVQAAQVRAGNAAANAYQAWGPALGRSLTEGSALARDLVQHKKVLLQVTLPLGAALAQAPERGSVQTTAGQRVTIEFVSPAGRTDPRIQGLSFFYTAGAESGALPGMNVIAFLPAGKPVAGVAIPASAVVWLQGRAWVYLQSAANTFSRHEIPTSEPKPGGGYVVPAGAPMAQSKGGAIASRAQAEMGGFPTDQPLVVSGAQLLLSEEFRAQLQPGGD